MCTIPIFVCRTKQAWWKICFIWFRAIQFNTKVVVLEITELTYDFQNTEQHKLISYSYWSISLLYSSQQHENGTDHLLFVAKYFQVLERLAVPIKLKYFITLSKKYEHNNALTMQICDASRGGASLSGSIEAAAPLPWRGGQAIPPQGRAVAASEICTGYSARRTSLLVSSTSEDCTENDANGR